ncbi:helix-turn-helix domain-containing protein [Maridesulfovibrio hydrothermalis]|uniref:HTH merR-type domain-containing protein n=1 Tax=Maridesulfovibrio hydrothermalis AM13 = DSM 14728 TaxID=1121451 RepID=L0RBY2_9BACT|nr:helix-turn-helix domain-containing protein [Maridesulfovibrio hydrothermalis]CCO23061.1 conserved protein of unknown function [Maridesulfovibrio hydrothermalis AM13 = DSM 14728]
MTTDTFTHKDLSSITGVSVTTIKSYRKKFPEFFFISGHGKPLRFRKGTDKLCIRIRDLFDKNLSVKQIRSKLLTEFESVKSDRQLSVTKADTSVSSDEFEKLSRTTMQMMNGLAALVTAQAKAEQRLGRIEKSIKELIEIQSGNNSSSNELLAEIKNVLSSAGSLQQPERVTAKKVITIKKENGKAESYAFESDYSTIEPEKDFLELPVVIQSENEEFLGMPGRPGHPFTLHELVYLITRKKDNVASKVWHKQGRDWILSFKTPDGLLYELFFQRTKTPKGNIVSFFKQLNINSEPQNQSYIITFFREVRDLIDSV